MRTSFADLKSALEEARAFLRGFTLGRRGFTQRDGLAAMERVQRLCKRLDRYGSGPNAEEAAMVAARARSCISAAQARLALLRHK